MIENVLPQSSISAVRLPSIPAFVTSEIPCPLTMTLHWYHSEAEQQKSSHENIFFTHHSQQPIKASPAGICDSKSGVTCLGHPKVANPILQLHTQIVRPPIIPSGFEGLHIMVSAAVL